MSDEGGKAPANDARGSKARPLVAKQAFTIEEVAASLGLSEKTVDGLIANGEVGSVLIGKRARRITAKQLDDYLRGLERASGWAPSG